MKIKGKFISNWDNDIEISTKAELNTKTGEVISESLEVVGLDILNEEIFIADDEEIAETYIICEECHEYILKIEILEGVGKQLYEHYHCMNPDCDNSSGELPELLFTK